MTPHEAIAYMYDQMSEFGDYGTNDSEPRYLFENMLRTLWHEGIDAVKIPHSSAGWDLYGGKRGVASVAGILHDSAKLAVEACNKDHSGFQAAMEYYYGGI